MLKLNYTFFYCFLFFQRSKLLEKRIEEIRKSKEKIIKDIKLFKGIKLFPFSKRFQDAINLIDDALNGLDELEDFVENFKYKIVNYYNEAVLDGGQ